MRYSAVATNEHSSDNWGRREARHPNCIQFMGTTQNDSKYYIVTEYVPNGNLKKWLEERGDQLTWRLRVSFATDIARALAYLHSKSIIHRCAGMQRLAGAFADCALPGT